MGAINDIFIMMYNMYSLKSLLIVVKCDLFCVFIVLKISTLVYYYIRERSLILQVPETRLQQHSPSSYLVSN